MTVSICCCFFRCETSRRILNIFQTISGSKDLGPALCFTLSLRPNYDPWWNRGLTWSQDMKKVTTFRIRLIPKPVLIPADVWYPAVWQQRICICTSLTYFCEAERARKWRGGKIKGPTPTLTSSISCIVNAAPRVIPLLLCLSCDLMARRAFYKLTTWLAW